MHVRVQSTSLSLFLVLPLPPALVEGNGEWSLCSPNIMPVGPLTLFVEQTRFEAYIITGLSILHLDSGMNMRHCLPGSRRRVDKFGENGLLVEGLFRLPFFPLAKEQGLAFWRNAQAQLTFGGQPPLSGTNYN